MAGRSKRVQPNSKPIGIAETTLGPIVRVIGERGAAFIGAAGVVLVLVWTLYTFFWTNTRHASDEYYDYSLKRRPSRGPGRSLTSPVKIPIRNTRLCRGSFRRQNELPVPSCHRDNRSGRVGGHRLVQGVRPATRLGCSPCDPVSR